ncbi:MAG: hypothetical protein ABUL60_19525 [Myxococcales bacterium]
MKLVIDRLEEKTREFSQLPLFAFLRDESIEPRKRLAFVPSVAHFVMSFADLYAFVLQVDPPGDEYQALVNAHAREDENHWRWFLDDMEKLGLDDRVRFSDALRFIWSDATVKTRALTYRMCRLGYGATSLEKLVLVHVIEAAGKVTIDGVSAVGTSYSKQTGKKLVYLGHHHLATESDHTIEDADVHRGITEIQVPADQEPGLLALVDQGFAAFSDFAGEMLATAQAERVLTPSP